MLEQRESRHQRRFLTSSSRHAIKSRLVLFVRFLTITNHVCVMIIWHEFVLCSRRLCHLSFSSQLVQLQYGRASVFVWKTRTRSESFWSRWKNSIFFEKSVWCGDVACAEVMHARKPPELLRQAASPNADPIQEHTHRHQAVGTRSGLHRRLVTYTQTS